MEARTYTVPEHRVTDVASSFTKEEALAMFREMVRLRCFDERCLPLKLKDLIMDGFHPYSGQEAVAVGVCQAFEADLHLLRVVSYPVEIASPYLPHTIQMNRKVVEEAKHAAGDYLKGIARRLAEEGTQATTHVVVDHQGGHTIAHEAGTLEADLLVMATHGRGGLQRALLGSTTDKVIRSVQIPVLVRRPE